MTKNNFKNLLATASALAVLAGTGVASAATISTNANPSALGTGGNWSGGVAPVAGDTIKLGGAHDVTLNAGAGVAFGAFDINNNTGKTITVGDAFVYSFTGLADTGGAAGDVVNAKYGAAGTLSITDPKTYLGAVNFANNAGTLTLTTSTASATTGAIDDATGGGAASVVSANSSSANAITFGVIGGTNAVSKLSLDTAGTVVNLSAGANQITNVNFTKAGTLNLPTGADVAGAINPNIADSVVNVAGASTVTTVALDNGGALKLASGANLTGNVTFANAADALNLIKSTVTGNITSTADGDGKVDVSGGDCTITGTLGTGHKTGSVNFSDDSKLILSDTSTIAAVTATTSGQGTLQVATGKTATVDTVGAAGSSLKGVVLVNTGALTVTGKEFHSNVDGSSNVANEGTLTFSTTDTVAVDGKIGATAGVNKFIVSGAAGTVNLGTSVVKLAELNFGADSTVTLSDVGTLGEVTAVNGSGTLNLSNNSELKVNDIGANAAALKAVNIKGGDLTLGTSGTGGLYTGALTFEKDATVTVKSDIGKAGTITTSTDGTGSIVTSAASTLTVADIGSSDKQLKLVKVNGATFALGGFNVYAPIMSDTADSLSITGVGKNVSTVTLGQLGSSAAELKAVSVDTAGTAVKVNGAVFAKDFNVTVANEVSFAKSVSGATMTLSDNNAKVNFATNANAPTAIKAGAAGNGQVTFAGGHTVGSIGDSTTNLGTVTFSSTSASDAVALNGDIYANTVSMGAATFSIPANRTISGSTATTLTGSSVNLGANNLTIAKASTLNDIVNINASVASTTSYGQVIFSDAVTQGSSNKINITLANSSTTDLPVGTFTILTGKAAGIDVSALKNVTVTSNSLFLTATGVADATNKAYNVVTSYDAGKASEKLAKAGASSLSAKLFAGFANQKDTITGSAGKLAAALDSLYSTDTTKAVEMANRLTPGSSAVSTSGVVANNLVDNASSASATAQTRLASLAGVAAGDEDGKLDIGVWVNGFANQATQKARKGSAGFKGDTFGGTLGVDTQLNDATLVGMSATYSTSDLKLKNYKAGDKIKSKNLFFTVYGRHELANDWFVQGSAGFGSGNVSTKEKRMTVAGSETASAKYDTMTFSLDALAGYNYKVADNASLVPMVGLKYIRANEGGYTETGTTYQNLTVTKKATDKFYGVIGARVQGAMEVSGLAVTPEAHAFLNYDFVGKNPKTLVKIDGLTSAVDVTGAKPARMYYNLGGSLMSKTDTIEYGIGYDARLADKYVSHQGTLKVKVNL